jgi:hypothetical protein
MPRISKGWTRLATVPLLEQPVVSYRASWRRYRCWYAASLGLFIAFLPAFALTAQRYPSLMHSGSVIIFAFFAYAALWMAVTAVARRWKCPRCGHCFFLRDVMQTQWPMVFIRSCRNCNLPKYANEDPDLRDNPTITEQRGTRA